METVFLFTPATRFDANAPDPSFGADVVIIDLEDSIHASAKVDARRRLADFDLSAHVGSNCKFGVRVNSLATLDGLRDLETIICLLRCERLQIDYLNVPKIRSHHDLVLYRALLRDLPRSIRLMPLIETVSAIDDIDPIAELSDAMLFGQADLVADMYSPNRAFVSYARARFCIACAKYEIPAIDTNSFEIHDMAFFREECLAARQEGFTAKAVIHPRQVASTFETLGVTDSELDGYRRTIERYNNEARGFSIDGSAVIAPPFIAKARKMLALYEVGTSGVARDSRR